MRGKTVDDGLACVHLHLDGIYRIYPYMESCKIKCIVEGNWPATAASYVNEFKRYRPAPPLPVLMPDAIQPVGLNRTQRSRQDADSTLLATTQNVKCGGIKNLRVMLEATKVRFASNMMSFPERKNFCDALRIQLGSYRYEKGKFTGKTSSQEDDLATALILLFYWSSVSRAREMPEHKHWTRIQPSFSL